MRKQVVEVVCARCARVEHVAFDGAPPPATTFVGRLEQAPGGDLVVEWGDLCAPCTKTIRNHLVAAGKPIKGTSPERKKSAVLESVVALRPDVPEAKKKHGTSVEPPAGALHSS